MVLQEDGNVISERESARIVWTRLYFDFRCLRCLSSQTSSGRHFAGFTVAIKTPGICVNFALKNEIMLFGIISGIISELISRITWSLPLVYSVYFGKIYRFIYAGFPKGNTIVGKRRIQDFRAQYTCNWARLKTAKGLFFENSKNGTLLILSWINSSIN